jgi:hypothetical protein
MMNRLPADELLTQIETTHAELRAASKPRRQSSGDLDVRWRLPQLRLFREANRSRPSVAAPGF